MIVAAFGKTVYARLGGFCGRENKANVARLSPGTGRSTPGNPKLEIRETEQMPGQAPACNGRLAGEASVGIDGARAVL